MVCKQLVFFVLGDVVFPRQEWPLPTHLQDALVPIEDIDLVQKAAHMAWQAARKLVVWGVVWPKWFAYYSASVFV